MKETTRRGSPERLIILIILAVTFAVFSRSLQAGFVHWDDDIVYDNPHIRGLDWQRIYWMFTDLHYLWRYMPLTWLGWAVTYELFGLNPFGYHLGNVLFHCANAVLVFLLLRKLLLIGTQSESAAADRDYLLWCCGLGAMLWAIHPLRVEPVAWVTDRVYCQALFLLLISLLCYLQFSDPANPAARRFFWCSVSAFAVSLLSYQTGLGYVIVLAVLDAWPLKRFHQGNGWWRDATARRIWLEKLPFAAVAALVVVLTLLARFQTTGGRARPVSLAEFGLLERALQAFYIWTYYFWKPWFPVNLSPYYTALISVEPTAARFLISLVVVLTLTVLLWCNRHRWPLLWTLWLCHLILLVPVLGLTEHPHYSSDRYSIIAGITWSVLVAAGLFKFGEIPRLRRLMPIAITSILVVLGTLSYSQTGIWQNSVALHEHMIAELDGSPYRVGIYLRLGHIYYSEQGNDEAAAACFRQVLLINPNISEAHSYLAVVLQRQGKIDEAISHDREVLRMNPNDYGSHNNLGAALAAQGKFEEAITHLSEAVRLNPGSPNAHRNLARALTQLGKADEARMHELEAQRLDAGQPGLPP